MKVKYLDKITFTDNLDENLFPWQLHLKNVHKLSQMPGLDVPLLFKQT